MPFTLSHPVIILPFRKIGSVTALVIGSIVPDFEGFVLLDTLKKFSHSWIGAILLDLPLGLLLCYVFHLVVRKPLIKNLPYYFIIRFERFYDFDWISYANSNKGKVLLSLIAGIVSHILWDQLTHAGSIIPGMEKEVQLLGISDPLFVFVQYAFSIPALMIIAIFIHRLPVSTDFLGRSNRTIYWSLAALVFLIIFAASFNNYHNARYYGNILINTCISGLLAGILISSLYFTLRRYKSKGAICKSIETN